MGGLGARMTWGEAGGEDGGGEAGGRGRRRTGGCDTLSSVILGLVPRIRRAGPPSGARVARAADPRLKGEDDGGGVGARMTWGEAGGEDGGGEAGERGRRRTGGCDTLSVVILGLVPRIRRAGPASGAHVAHAADPRLEGEDDGGGVGTRMTPSPPSSSGLSRGSAEPAPRAAPMSPAPQILASRARMMWVGWGRGRHPLRRHPRACPEDPPSRPPERCPCSPRRRSSPQGRG